MDILPGFMLYHLKLQHSRSSVYLLCAAEKEAGLLHTVEQGNCSTNTGRSSLCRESNLQAVNVGMGGGVGAGGKLPWTFSAHCVNILTQTREAISLSLTWGRLANFHKSKALGFLTWLWPCQTIHIPSGVYMLPM